MKDSAQQGRAPAGGKILRVKQGYNPNSSSMGSLVFALPAALMAVTLGFGTLSALILARFVKEPAPGEPDQAPGAPDQG